MAQAIYYMYRVRQVLKHIENDFFVVNKSHLLTILCTLRVKKADKTTFEICTAIPGYLTSHHSLPRANF